MTQVSPHITGLVSLICETILDLKMAQSPPDGAASRGELPYSSRIDRIARTWPGDVGDPIPPLDISGFNHELPIQF